MKHGTKTASAIKRARSLLDWEAVLDQLLSVISHGKRDAQDILHLEGIIQDFLAGKRIGGPDYTPSEPTDIHLYFLHRMKKKTQGPRLKYLRYLIRVFGVQGVSTIFYNLLSTRTYNCLITAPHYIRRLEDYPGCKFAPLDAIATLTRTEICKIRNAGRTTVQEVQRVLELFGLSLGMAKSDVDAIFQPEPESSSEQS